MRVLLLVWGFNEPFWVCCCDCLDEPHSFSFSILSEIPRCIPVEKYKKKSTFLSLTWLWRDGTRSQKENGKREGTASLTFDLIRLNWKTKNWYKHSLTRVWNFRTRWPLSIASATAIDTSCKNLPSPLRFYLRSRAFANNLCKTIRQYSWRRSRDHILTRPKISRRIKYPYRTLWFNWIKAQRLFVACKVWGRIP